MADEKWIAGLKPDMPISEAARLTLNLRLRVVRDRLPAAVFQAEEDTENVHQLRVSTRRAGAAVRLFREYLPPGLGKRLRRELRSLRRAAGEARDWDVFLDLLRPRL